MTRRLLLVLAVAGPSLHAPLWASAAAQARPAAPPAAAQIAAAVLPLPPDLRAGATVLGYGEDGRLVPLRRGAGEMTCLASNPARTDFHVACYHRSLEPFMARGRALRAGGVTGDQVDTVRFAEVRAGKLAMPSHAAMLYSLTGPSGSVDAASGEARGARRLFVTYVPGATAATTGLSTKPSPGAPWIMFPGTPKAHIMYTPDM
jgi:hypothetical protein